MRYGITMFATDVSIDVVELAREAEARGFAVALAPRAHPHPGQPPHAAADRRRRAAPRSTSAASTRSSPWPPRPSATDHPPARHRHPPAGPARADRHRQGGRHPRPPQRRPGRARRRLRLERGRARAPRRRDARTGGPSPASTSWPCRRCGPTTRPASTASTCAFAPSWSWPKPVQRGADGRPGVPVLLGGAPGPKLFAHIAEYGDGWIPIGGAGLTEAIPGCARRWPRPAAIPTALEIVPFGSHPRPGQARPLRAHRRHRVRVPPARARRATSCSRSSTSRPPSSPAACERGPGATSCSRATASGPDDELGHGGEAGCTPSTPSGCSASTATRRPTTCGASASSTTPSTGRPCPYALPEVLEVHGDGEVSWSIERRLAGPTLRRAAPAPRRRRSGAGPDGLRRRRGRLRGARACRAGWGGGCGELFTEELLRADRWGDLLAGRLALQLERARPAARGGVADLDAAAAPILADGPGRGGRPASRSSTATGSPATCCSATTSASSAAIDLGWLTVVGAADHDVRSAVVFCEVRPTATTPATAAVLEAAVARHLGADGAEALIARTRRYEQLRFAFVTEDEHLHRGASTGFRARGDRQGTRTTLPATLRSCRSVRAPHDVVERVLVRLDRVEGAGAGQLHQLARAAPGCRPGRASSTPPSRRRPACGC